MAKNLAFKAEAREQAGKGVARSLRREKKVPAVIYGDGKEPVAITLMEKDIDKEYYKGHLFTTLSDITVGSDKHLVLARDVQLHPVTDRVLHADFLRVTPKTKISVNVPVHFINEEKSPGIEKNGVLNVVRYEVLLTCQATKIPEAIEVDLASFDIGDAIKISDVKLPEGAKQTEDRDFTIATIAAPKVADDEDEAEAAEGEEGEAAEGEAAEGEEKAEGEGEKSE